MIKKKIDIELFYERDETGYKRPEGTQYLGEQEEADVECLITNLSDCSFRDYRTAKSDYQIEIGRTLLQTYVLESKYAPDFAVECDVVIRLTELDDAAWERLMLLGYNQAEAEKKNLHCKKQYWAFRCLVWNGHLRYSDTFTMKMTNNTEQWVAELRSEESLSLIRNPEYQTWLRGCRSHWWINYEDIIIGAPISVQEKIRMLRDIDPLKGRAGRRYPDRCKIEKVYAKALKLTEEDTPVSMYVLHEKYRTEGDKKQNVQERVMTLRTFSEVLSAIAAKDHGEEPDEFDCRWNYAERFDLREGAYQKTSSYVISEKGVIWHASVTDILDIPGAEADKERHNLWRAASDTMAKLDLPAPYQPGDIVTFDCRPFRAPYHAMVMYESEGECYSSPDFLFHTAVGWGIDPVEFIEHSEEAFSPFYRMERFEGELPESENMLGVFSRAIKADPHFTRRIADIYYHAAEDEIDGKLEELAKETTMNSKNQNEKVAPS